MLSELLSPEAQIKKLFKRQLPQLKNDLTAIVDDLLLQAADQCEENPFELVLVLFKQKGKAIASVYNRQKNCLLSMDAGALLASKFYQQLEVLPATVKGLVIDKLEGQDVTQIIVKALAGKRLFIHYGENEELLFFEVSKKDKKQIVVDDFLNTFEF